MKNAEALFLYYFEQLYINVDTKKYALEKLTNVDVYQFFNDFAMTVRPRQIYNELQLKETDAPQHPQYAMKFI